MLRAEESKSKGRWKKLATYAILLVILAAPLLWFYSVYNKYYEGVAQREQASDQQSAVPGQKPAQ